MLRSRRTRPAGCPTIDVSPNQGKLLELLARMQGASAILELGTLGGYSTIWLARALPPGGRLVTLEVEPRHAEVAAANIERAGLSDLVELRVGPAVETLPQLVAEEAGPFDLIFIDADKKSYPDYFEWSSRALAARARVIVADNVVRRGEVADPDEHRPQRGRRAPPARARRRRARASPRPRSRPSAARATTGSC